MTSSMSTSPTTMDIVNLPETLEDFSRSFENSSDFNNILKKCDDPGRLLPREYTQWKFAGSGLMAGRPMDSAVIFMSGASGSGKSSTVNYLFEDSTFTTSSIKSETKLPSMVQKKLKVPLQNSPQVGGYIRFVDVPGCFDTDGRQEAANLAGIQRFKSSISCLKPRRKDICAQSNNTVREVVYPNVVLFVVKASDNLLGEGLRKSLEILKTFTNIVDTERPNLVVALTHCMSMAVAKPRFEAKVNDATVNLRSVIKSVLGIDNVDVVPVENEPYDFGLKRNGDFYQLPNGEASHYNLLQAMLKLCDANNDVLGRLFLGHYFGTQCPEKLMKATVIHPKALEPSMSDLTVAEKVLQDQNMVASAQTEVREKAFQLLGYGYCPVNEKIKYASLINPGKTTGLALKVVEIQGVKFTVPSCIKATYPNKSRFHCVTFFAKEEYQSHMKSSYGIDVDLKLVVKASSEGKWVAQGNSERSTSVISMIQETELATFAVENPEESVVFYGFRTELEELPDKFDNDHAPLFRSFFSKWGTHMVCELSLGGKIQLDCTVEKQKITQDNIKSISGNASSVFESLVAPVTVKSKMEGSAELKKLREAGVTNEHLQMEGGSPPALITLKTIKSEQVQDWAASIAKEPVELKHTMKLYPFYNLLPGGKKQQCLRRATKEYMDGTLENRIKDEYGLERDAVSKAEIDKADAQAAGRGCFPSGTMIQLEGHRQIKIEELQNGPSQVSLTTIPLKTSLRKMKLATDNLETTSFCTFLDKGPDAIMNYLELQFNNGRKLTTSPGHLIFQSSPETGRVIAKQAKHFKIGDHVIYRNNEKNETEMPTLEVITEKVCRGVWCPLTTSGTFLADGFLVTSYAHVDSFLTAQVAMLPLKIWCMLSNHYVNGKYNKAISDKPSGADDDSTHPSIHPFAKGLMSVRKNGNIFK